MSTKTILSSTPDAGQTGAGTVGSPPPWFADALREAQILDQESKILRECPWWQRWLWRSLFRARRKAEGRDPQPPGREPRRRLYEKVCDRPELAEIHDPIARRLAEIIENVGSS